MSKELVVSSNRHEIRVALLEDDQLVEIYHQRHQEYSLAGSIHKGRVTRVLPGMQSAFVDIGLDRDAFLYVSDFFEDNEEYDQVVSSAEERVLRMEKGGPAAAVTPAAAGDAAAPVAPVTTSVAPVSAPGLERGPDRGPDRRPDRGPERGSDRDRGGRGRRRRRGGRPPGQGFPDSKYASPVSEVRSPIREEAPAAARSDDAAGEDLIVLPGESLRKYGSQTPSSFDAEPETLEAEFERPLERSLEPPLERPEVTIAWQEAAPAEETFEPTPAEQPLRAEEPSAAELAAEEDAAPSEQAAALAEVFEAIEDARSEAAANAEVTQGESENSAAAADSAGDSEGLAVSEAAEAPTDAESGALDIEQPAGTSAADTEEVEHARIPTSLTATLREQGPRYLHRVSRRMRRRMRAGGSITEDGTSEAQPAAVSRPEQATVSTPDERRAGPDDRRGPRPERTERPERERTEKPPQPSIADLLREGQEIIVQIAKEPLGAKGARITSYVALPGRYVVYMPTVEHVGVSRKIGSDEERHRLKRILQTHKAGLPGGFILRTAGEGRTEEDLRADMMFLYNLWTDLRAKAEKKKAPALVHHDLDVVQRILRDQLTASFKNIWVDNEEMYENVVGFVQRFQPALVSRVKLYTRPTPIFDAFNITSELEKALRPKVWLKSGGYIVINQTEALVAIDINTGKYVGKSNRLEDTIVKTNTDAVKEIVRQIRLRDLGGIIVVDFIDMDERKNRQKVMQALEEAMRADKAPNKILQFNDFGLVAITRKRVKQSLERTLCAPCPYCDGAGYVKSVTTVINEILQEALKIARAVEGSDVMLRVHPEVAKVLKSHKNDYLQELEEILGRTVIVKTDPLLHQEKFDLA